MKPTRRVPAARRAQVDDEAGAAQLGGALEVEDAEGLAEFPVRLGLEIELPLFAPGLYGDVVMLRRRRWGPRRG